MPYLNAEQIAAIGFRSVGEDVLISPDARFYNPAKISIGSHVRIDDFSILSAGEGGIVLADYVHVAPFCGLMGAGEIRMDDFSGISSRVFIYSSSDDYSGETLTNPTVPNSYKNIISGPVHLGRHVIVGTVSTIFPNITIGDGSAIGAYSMVTKPIAAGVIATGRPCRTLKARKGDVFELEKKLREEE